MYRKLIFTALAGTLLLGLSTHSMATSTTGGPAHHRTADGFVTSNWPGVKGLSTKGLLASMNRDATITLASAEAPTGTDSTEDKTAVSDQSTDKGESGFRRFDTRDPRNHIIKPGGVVIVQ